MLWSSWSHPRNPIMPAQRTLYEFCFALPASHIDLNYVPLEVGAMSRASLGQNIMVLQHRVVA